MALFRIDPNFVCRPHVLEAGPHAMILYMVGLCYISRELTDGFIPHSEVVHLMPSESCVEATKRLVEAKLWITDTERDGYWAPDFLLWNPTREEIFRRRANEAERDFWGRIRPHLAPRIMRRDSYACVYCGARDDLTIDHVVPIVRGGSHEPENL